MFLWKWNTSHDKFLQIMHQIEEQANSNTEICYNTGLSKAPLFFFQPVSMGNYPTPTYSTIGIDSKRYSKRAPTAPMSMMFERPLNDSSQLVHHQFNSPMRLYSQKNVAEAIKEQTGVSTS